jgi:flagellar motor switch protein FliN
MNMTPTEKLMTGFEQGFPHFLPTLSKVINNILNREIDITYTADKDQNLESFYQDGKSVPLYLHFSSGEEVQYQYSFAFDSNFISTCCAWVSGAEPEENLSTETLEQFKQTVEQLIEQVRNDQKELPLGDVAFSPDSLPEGIALNNLPDSGLIVHYTLTNDGTSISCGCALWKAELAAVPLPSDQMSVHPVEFESFTAGEQTGSHPQSLEMLMDVELEIYVELGRKYMLIKDILKLGKGSVVELDKAAGEPLGIFVNGRKFAEGEVVVVDDHFGIRITQLLDQKERIKSIKK